MTNKAKRNLSLVMVIIGAITLIGLAISRKFFGIQHDIWQYFAAPLWICFFVVLYRNFRLAVKKGKE